MNIVVAGASGFLGSHLVQQLQLRGHVVTRLVRRSSTSPDESTWDPYAGELDRALVGSADVVINVAGSSTLGNPHSHKWARELRESRVTTTRVLAGAIAGAERPPAFLAGNGVSVYGDHGNEVVTESSDSRGDALLTSVTREWEAATSAAHDVGGRVCILRTAPVLDRDSAPLKQQILQFKAGLGGRLGNGRQYFPIISLRDWVAAVTFLAEDPEANGPFNLCCPDAPTNADYTSALASALSRKAFLTVPAAVVKVAAGPMAPEVLGSIRARPAALERAGYDFQDRDVRDVLRTALA